MQSHIRPVRWISSVSRALRGRALERTPLLLAMTFALLFSACDRGASVEGVWQNRRGNETLSLLTGGELQIVSTNPMLQMLGANELRIEGRWTVEKGKLLCFEFEANGVPTRGVHEFSFDEGDLVLLDPAKGGRTRYTRVEDAKPAKSAKRKSSAASSGSTEPSRTIAEFLSRNDSARKEPSSLRDTVLPQISGPSAAPANLGPKEIQSAVRKNLIQLSAALDMHCLENGVVSARYDDLVGPKKFIRSLESVDGEDYREVKFAQGEPLSVTTRSGITVTYRN